MSKKPLAPSELTELIAGLHRLARNLWWTWNQESQEIFHELSPRGWQNLYHNAVAILHEVSDYELRVHLQDPDFAERVRQTLAAFDEYLNDTNTWGRANAPLLLANPVCYFTAEFGFHETLPIAAGGLGILAGDHAKSASDLGLGFVGISLFYREGTSSSPSTRTTGRLITTPSSTRTISRLNRCSTRPASRWFARWTSASTK